MQDDSDAENASVQSPHRAVRELISQGKGVEKYMTMKKRPLLKKACKDAIEAGDWACVKAIAALHKSIKTEVVNPIVGPLLAKACAPEPLDEATAVENVRTFLANKVVQDLLKGDDDISGMAFKTAIKNGHVEVVRVLVEEGAAVTSDHISEILNALITRRDWSSVYMMLTLTDLLGKYIEEYVAIKKLRKAFRICNEVIDAVIAKREWTRVSDMMSLSDVLSRTENVFIKELCQKLRKSFELCDEVLDPAIARRDWVRISELISQGKGVEKYMTMKKRPLLKKACKDAIEAGDWACVKAIAALHKSIKTEVVNPIVGPLLAKACAPEPLDEATAVENVRTFLANKVVQDLLKGDDDISGMAFKTAIKNGHVEVVRVLVEEGAAVSTLVSALIRPYEHVNRGLISLLDYAFKRRNLEIIKYLVRLGAKGNKDGESVLHIALRMNKVEFAKKLLENDHDPHIVDNKGRTLMHVIRDMKAFKLVSEDDVSVTAIDEDGYTPLHWYCVKCMEHGVRVDTEVLCAFLDRVRQFDPDPGAVSRYVSERDKDGFQVLDRLLEHEDATKSLDTGVDPVFLLLDAGADVSGISFHRSPLYSLLNRRHTNRRYHQLLYSLCSRGAEWDINCEVSLRDAVDSHDYYLEQHGRDGPDIWDDQVGESEIEEDRYRTSRACVQQWMRDKKNGNPLMVIPFEVFQTDERGILAYIADIQSSDAKDRTWRRKICVVGPSMWGKSSLVRSIIANQSTLADKEGRTLGVDVHEYQFVIPPSHTKDQYQYHEVSFWDFAGQDVYRATHQLFFTQKTLYILCVDLYEYCNLLLGKAAMDSGENGEATSPTEEAKVNVEEREEAMSRFVTKRVLRWVEGIVSVQGSVDFFVVGTKSDLLENGDEQHVWDDLKPRLKSSEVLRSSGASFAGYITTSCVDDFYVERARSELREFLVTSNRSFPMGKALTAARNYVIERRRDGANGSPNELIATTTEVSQQLKKICPDMDPDTYLLPVLENLGEILLRKGKLADVLQNRIIFDPRLVIDLVKEVVNHKRASPAAGDSGRRLREEGLLCDDDLVTGELWGQLSGDRKRAFKKWLMELDVAYPADSEEMETDSDLIVPAYWSMTVTNPIVRSAVSSLTAPAKTTIAWRYEVPGSVSEVLLKKFAVRSYHPHLARRVSWSGQARTITIAINMEIEVQVTLQVRETERRDVICIHVGAADEKQAVLLLQYFVVEMESVLESNATVERKLSVADDKAILVTKIQKELKGPLAKRSVWPRVAADFLWYEHRKEPPTLLSIKKQLDDLQVQIARGDLGKRVPGRWTVRLDESTKTLELKMLSDEPPHDCYHEPISISVPWWRKHGEMFQTTVEFGKDVLIEVLPEMLVEFGAGKLVNMTRRAEVAHAIIVALRLSDGRRFSSVGSGFSEEENENSLIALLKLADKDIEVDGQIQRLCKLQRELKEGRYVWVHDDSKTRVTLDLAFEIVNGKNKVYEVAWDLLHPCHPEPIACGNKDASTISCSFGVEVESMEQLRACELRVVVKPKRFFLLSVCSRRHETTAKLGEKIAVDASAVDLQGVLSPGSASYQVRYQLKSSP